MKKITLALCTSIILSGLVACGNTDENNENAANPEGVSDGSINMDKVSHQTDERDDFTVDDRVKRDEDQGSRNKTDGRGTFWFNNPQDVTDKDTFTEEEREAEKERAQRYEQPDPVNDGTAESIEQAINAMDDVEESYVVVEGARVIVGIQTKGDDVDQVITDIEERLQDEIEDKELVVTDDKGSFEQMREMREGR
ncbi:YhcN/YlaJ family sporulation lipoprotein [Salicibibacter kimchii]|uniref:SpoIIIAH-like family protein n=1 Tax=Salicibibacter kimchii TaxID=2099786 RepID=A0A345C348_9BACI|nr:YhcN/YlaJ family sporulation lipoprotein [Salicibibacter kimchii]AXF57629.1 hypothetical protein DT065_17640 [Salicibibacter kimchii]